MIFAFLNTYAGRHGNTAINRIEALLPGWQCQQQCMHHMDSGRYRRALLLKIRTARLYVDSCITRKNGQMLGPLM